MLAVLSFASPLAAQTRVPGPRPEVIYGSDDRLDLFQVKHPKVRELADATVALFQGYDVKPDPAAPGTSNLSTSIYGERMDLCKEEPFFPQPMGAFCSGSLVAPDIVMTAGHCVRSESACQGTKFVFGFGVYQEGVYPTSVPTGEVYSCQKLLGREELGTGADWALVKLDREVAGHKVLKLNRTGVIKKGTPLFVVGHPAGLPTKVAGGAAVRDETPGGYFVANLDTYGGNSGSAVFNATSGLVEGILVRGETDYVYRGGCRVSYQCADDACRGEDVTKVAEVLEGVPPTGLEATFVSPGEAALSLLRLAGADASALGVSSR
ncbi:MAG: trypsin-like peptidase domain-containing protein [Elusimicrobia bacterium]|nr:trypsin-like peptidase domain-containing protein [Elusimicrobiota bacterium]